MPKSDLDILWNSQLADPVDEDCLGHSEGLFIWNRNGLRVLGRGIRHGEDVLVVFLRSFERAKEIEMDPFVGSSGVGSGLRGVLFCGCFR